MPKLLLATMLLSALASAAQAGSPRQDQTWLNNISLVANDALSEAAADQHGAGVVYVPMSVDSHGRTHVRPLERVCGDAEIGRRAVRALASIQGAPRPPADLTDQPILLRVVFTVPDVNDGDTEAVLKRCN